MSKDVDTTITLSVRVSLGNLALIGTYLDTTGIFTAAQPSGAMSCGLKMFAEALVANGLAKRPESLIEAIAMIKLLRYPKGQVENALLKEDVKSHRQQLTGQTVQVLGETTRSHAQAQKRMREYRERMAQGSEEELRKVQERAGTYDEWLDGQREGQQGRASAVEKELSIKHARAMGTIISEGDSSEEEINRVRAERDAMVLQEQKEATLAALAGRGVDVVAGEEDEFREFNKVAEKVVAAQPHVVNAEPAIAEPGSLETQEELKKAQG